MPDGKGRTAFNEVLSMEPLGEPNRSIATPVENFFGVTVLAASTHFT